jgi:tetratricopeptide (TPR) repeat protein
VVAKPQIVAQHCAEAGLDEKAIGYWLKAGQQSVARSAMMEAVAQLHKGLDLLVRLPDGPRRQQQELELHISLGPALAGAKGYSASEAGESIARACALAEQIDRPEYLVPLLYSQWQYHLVRAEHKLALSVAERLEKTGEARNDITAQWVGRRANGLTRLYLGELVAARAVLEQCHGLGDPAHRGVGAGLTEDPYAAVLANLAVTLAYLGHIDQARLRANEALSEARRLKHALTLTVVLCFANWLDWVISSPELQEHAEELLAITNEHGFPYYFGWATVFRGLSLIALRQPQEGFTLITRGLTAVGGTGAVINRPTALVALAETYAMLGQPVEGLSCLTEAAQIIERTEEQVDEADLRRLRGDLLNATGDISAAEQSYRQALAVAERQSAKLLELRAAFSLARLWRDQGKRAEARDLLAPIYGWFTEGFDTPVLLDAKALLDGLA